MENSAFHSSHNTVEDVLTAGLRSGKARIGIQFRMCLCCLTSYEKLELKAPRWVSICTHTSTVKRFLPFSNRRVQENKKHSCFLLASCFHKNKPYVLATGQTCALKQTCQHLRNAVSARLLLTSDVAGNGSIPLWEKRPTVRRSYFASYPAPMVVCV